MEIKITEYIVHSRPWRGPEVIPVTTRYFRNLSAKDQMTIPAEFQQRQLSDPNAILGFFGDYRWLSNFHLCPVFYSFLEFPSSENAFQAAKFMLPERAQFRSCTPKEAKKLGSVLKMMRTPEEWDKDRVKIMKVVLLDKFRRNADLAAKLLATEDKYLEETNWWGDKFWGVCNGVGENMLGKLLMEVRRELAKSAT